MSTFDTFLTVTQPLDMFCPFDVWTVLGGSTSALDIFLTAQCPLAGHVDLFAAVLWASTQPSTTAPLLLFYLMS
jgi:hypothetical protein